jgi:hypothetical protein
MTQYECGWKLKMVTNGEKSYETPTFFLQFNLLQDGHFLNMLVLKLELHAFLP